MSNANEPAYPMPPVYSPDLGAMLSHGNLGLTKREAFAMAAMQGILAADPKNEIVADRAAKWAIELADALLAELAKDSAP